MAFVEPITIKDAIESVHRKNYLLPAIQKEFVWGTYQIERHYIPDCSLGIINFKEFIEKRKKLISDSFRKLIEN